ncbi:MAG: hypothetical protein BMS9Abin08_0123 [Gammaproteobacteria bacterium]|nr:MAG: hypothetical protein BMS9Abin08_0123 [Gammaproteobacteria bacterium]
MKPNTRRRKLLQWLGASTGLATLSGSVRAEPIDRDLFDDPIHKLVYQFNKADRDYMEHVLFSVGAMLRKYGDEAHLVVTAIGPGLHILAKKPLRPIPDIVRQRVSSLAAYGVSFHACGNTMKALGWDKDDLLDFAEVVEIGADDLMLLQEQGYSYISW